VSANASAIVGYGASVSGSVNASKIQSDYASVQEQSVLRAGDGGFQVNVAGNTDLKGAVISSTASGAAASSLVTGSLTHSDIENYSKMSAASVGLGGSATQSGIGSRDALGTVQGIGSIKPIDLGETKSGGGISSVAATSNNETSTTRSGVGAATIVITNDTAQQAATGQSAETVLAGLGPEQNKGSIFTTRGLMVQSLTASKFSESTPSISGAGSQD
jgi:filamentous hemagglutinin